MSRSPIHLALAILALTSVSCSRAGEEDAPALPASGPVPIADNAIVNAAVAGPVASYREVNQLAISAPDELRLAALARLDDPDPVVHRAALYALTLSVKQGDDESVEALAELLDSPSAHERLRASSALLSVGEPAAVPVLIDLLASDTPVPNSDPPTAVWQVARGTLLAYVDQDLGLRAADDGGSEVAEAQSAWREWWAVQGDGLEWNPAIRQFSQ